VSGKSSGGDSRAFEGSDLVGSARRGFGCTAREEETCSADAPLLCSTNVEVRNGNQTYMRTHLSFRLRRDDVAL